MEVVVSMLDVSLLPKERVGVLPLCLMPNEGALQVDPWKSLTHPVEFEGHGDRCLTHS